MIVGVAITNGVLTIALPRPARHADCFRYMVETFGKDAGLRIAGTMNGVGQGFVTDKGKYLNRFQAMKHAKKCGQPLLYCDGCKHRWSDPLHSEDLW